MVSGERCYIPFDSLEFCVLWSCVFDLAEVGAKKHRHMTENSSTREGKNKTGKMSIDSSIASTSTLLVDHAYFPTMLPPPEL